MKVKHRFLIALILVLLTFSLVFTSCDETGDETTAADETTEMTTEETSPVESPDETTSEPHTHSYEDWSVAKKATCTEEGLEERYCSCGESESRTIAITDHNYKNETCVICGAILKTSQGLSFVLSEDKKSYYIDDFGTCYEYDLIIPSEYNGLPVTKLERNAFNMGEWLTSIIIPDSVTHICKDALSGCFELKSVTLGSGIKVIEMQAFEGDIGLTSINYKGTKSQWASVSLGEEWHEGSSIRVIHCIDGDITIN